MAIILSLGVLLAVSQGQIRVQEFAGPGETEIRFQVRGQQERLDPPKISPKQKWLFEYTTGAFARVQGASDPDLHLKFRIFSQTLKENDDPSMPSGRILLRFWDYVYRVLRFDHNSAYNNGIVDLYLCFAGEPGGEQLFDEEYENRISKRVNTMYIYQVRTFTNPVEMAREIAHEYGHAVLPPVGGFVTPEDWGTGYLGEKLFMRYLANQAVAKRIGPEDSMGATATQLKQFVAQEVDPLWIPVAKLGPNRKALSAKGKAAMDAYLGLVLYAELVLPTSAFSRSLKIIGSVHAIDYADAVANAVAELPTAKLRIPSQFVNKPVWIPFPKGSQITGATIQSRSGNWACIVAKTTSVQVIASVE